MPLYLTFTLLIPAIQVACALHAYQRGKQQFWFFIILMFPVVGSLIYFIAEVLPELRQSGGVVRKMESISWFKTRELDRLEENLEEVPTTENRLKLAAACVRFGQRDRAVELYRQSLEGAHAKDADIVKSLASALAEAENWSELLDVSSELRQLLNPGEINEAIRWEAIALDGLNHYRDAEERYLHLIESWPGEEIRCRLAMMLAREGRNADARFHFEAIRRHMRRGNSYYRSKNKLWAKHCSRWLKYLDRVTSAS